jgi:RND superfamily putative drug exporter
MAGMFFIGADIFNSVASGTITVVACAVLGSVTVLPAVLELLGDRIDRGQIPWLPHLRTETSETRFWPAVVDRVLRRPALSCVLAAGVLVALALPARSMSVAKPADEALASQDSPALRTRSRAPLRRRVSWWSARRSAGRRCSPRSPAWSSSPRDAGSPTRSG